MVGTPSNIDTYIIKNLYTKNGAFIHSVTKILLSCPTKLVLLYYGTNGDTTNIEWLLVILQLEVIVLSDICIILGTMSFKDLSHTEQCTLVFIDEVGTCSVIYYSVEFSS